MDLPSPDFRHDIQRMANQLQHSGVWDMKDSEKFAWLAAFVLLMFLIFAVGFIRAEFRQLVEMRQQAIEHNCAVYDENTGDFGWR